VHEAVCPSVPFISEWISIKSGIDDLSVSVRFDVLTAVNMKTMMFWVVTPYGPVGGY
jgi:hypothetical protein